MYKDRIKIQRVVKNKGSSNIFDNVAIDIPFCIFLDGLPFRTLIASPEKYRELTIGHLFTEGIINSLEDIAEESITCERGDIKLKNKVDLIDFSLTRDRILTTACNIDTINYDSLNEFKVSETPPPKNEIIFNIIEKLNRETPIYRATGGTHSAILRCNKTEYLFSAEDVGRHNAVDKVLGSGLIKQVSFSDCILASSGRLSGEILLKAARAGIPDVCSVSAPLISGINVAIQTGIRLYGFVRSQRFNKYNFNN